jgi:tellurite resistance protein TerC
LEQAKRAIRIASAFTLLVVGVAMLVLPGPGIVVVVVALAIVSAEFVWARILLDRLKTGVGRPRQALSRFLRLRG